MSQFDDPYTTTPVSISPSNDIPSSKDRQLEIQLATSHLLSLLPSYYQSPKVGIICGSGIVIEQNIVNGVYVSYSDIPSFPIPTVSGHNGKFLVGLLNDVVTICLLGRFHYYEGYNLQKVILPIGILVNLGVKSLIVTNAAGGLCPDFHVGDIMVIEDHISFLSLSGINPLRGENMSEFGPRFPSMMEAYSPKSYSIVAESAHAANISLSKIQRGVYVGVGGPSYETRAEVRFLTMIGGSSVGMSTVHEVIFAAHCGIQVIGLSVITNICDRRTQLEMESTTGEAPSHTEVLKAAQEAGVDMTKLLGEITRRLGTA